MRKILLSSTIIIVSIVFGGIDGARQCSNRRYKIDLHSSTPVFAYGQTKQFQSVYAHECGCYTWSRHYPKLTSNVQRVNSFGKCILLFRNASCWGWADVKLYARQRGGEWLNYFGAISGHVQSFKLC